MRASLIKSLIKDYFRNFWCVRICESEMNATTRTRVSSATRRLKFASGASKKTAKSETRRNSIAPFSKNAIMGLVRRNEAFIINEENKIKMTTVLSICRSPISWFRTTTLVFFLNVPSVLEQLFFHLLLLSFWVRRKKVGNLILKPKESPNQREASPYEAYLFPLNLCVYIWNKIIKIVKLFHNIFPLVNKFWMTGK